MNNRTTYFSKKVTLFNTIATILVVLLHSETPLRFGKPLEFTSYPFIYSIYTLSQIAVPLFFFISAILFYRDCEWQDIPRKLYKRIFTLAIPFFIWNVIFVIIYFALGKIPFTASKMALATPLNTPLQWADAIWNTRFTPLWFIKYLIFFCLLSPVILLLIKNKWVGMISTIGLLTASALFKWDSFSLQYWGAIYLAGAYAGRYFYNLNIDENSTPFRSSRMHFILSGTAFVAMWGLAIIDKLPWVLFQFFGPILVWFGADALPKDIIQEKFRVKAWMGYTFFIYATHYFLLNVEQTLVRAFLPATQLVLNLTFVITPILTLLIIIWTARWLSRYRFYKVLTGGR